MLHYIFGGKMSFALIRMFRNKSSKEYSHIRYNYFSSKECKINAILGAHAIHSKFKSGMKIYYLGKTSYGFLKNDDPIIKEYNLVPYKVTEKRTRQNIEWGKATSQSNIGSKFYNNGKIHRKIKPHQEVPKGWVPGALTGNEYRSIEYKDFITRTLEDARGCVKCAASKLNLEEYNMFRILKCHGISYTTKYDCLHGEELSLEVIEESLYKAKGNKNVCGDLLGISPVKLSRMIKFYNIDVNMYKAKSDVFRYSKEYALKVCGICGYKLDSICEYLETNLKTATYALYRHEINFDIGFEKDKMIRLLEEYNGNVLRIRKLYDLTSARFVFICKHYGIDVNLYKNKD
jgi:hypothetical protein